MVYKKYSLPGTTVSFCCFAVVFFLISCVVLFCIYLSVILFCFIVTLFVHHCWRGPFCHYLSLHYLSIIAREDPTVICQSWNVFGGGWTDHSEPKNTCYSEDRGMLSDRKLSLAVLCTVSYKDQQWKRRMVPRKRDKGRLTQRWALWAWRCVREEKLAGIKFCGWWEECSAKVPLPHEEDDD